MAVRGRLVEGLFAPVEAGTLSEATPEEGHAIYEVQAILERDLSFEDAEQAANAVWTGLGVGEGTILGVEAKGRVVRVQVLTSPFPWVVFLAGLPAILTGVGVLIQYLTVNRFIGAVPSWAWTALILAGSASLVLWALSMALRPRDVSVPSWARRWR